jgi:hypothetical protein
MGWDSLTIANTVECLSGGVVSTNPACAGAMFRLQPGADPGAPQPTTDFVASLLLDGERPFGRRASNRTIKLPIWITAPTRQRLAAAREVLQQAVDQDFFTITWTRDPFAGNPGNTPLPLVFDCFRAQPTVPIFNTLTERQLIGMQIELTIPALPYGRSATQTQVSFAAPVPTSPAVIPPPSPVVLDNFAAISSTQFSQSSQCVVGPYTGCWDPDSFGDAGGQVTSLSYGSSFSAPLNLTGMTSLQMWFGLGSRYYSNLEYHGKIHGTSFYFTLTDTGGNQLSFSRGNLLLPVSNSAQSPVFTRVTVPIPQISATFNYAGVESYSLTVLNRQDRVRRLSWVTAYLDALTAYPGSQFVAPVTRGAVYTLYGVAGTARAPVSMSFQQAPTPGTPTTITATGPGTYTVPAGTAYLAVNGIGGGGAGAGMTGAGVGAGGGGAEDAGEAVFPASPGQVIPYVVGAGAAAGASPVAGQQTVFGPAPGGTLQVLANGGGSVATNGTTAGLGGSGSLNSIEWPGGAGRANPSGTFGGGGGSSAGPLSAGNTPMGSGSVLYTTAGTYTGSGSGWLCPAGVTQVLAECWAAGGGGGGGSGSGNGAGGGGGEYRNQLVPVTPGTYYTVVVGAGGSGGTAGGGTGGNGGLSSFTGNSGIQVIAEPGQGGINTGWQGMGAGGTGGTGTGAGYPGGRGGNSYPYTGGGGSSAGPSAQGNNGSSPGGGIAPSQGGNGGNGSGASTGTGAAGQAPGGGGGGAYNNSYAGGAGAAGQVRLTYPATTGAPTAVGGTAVSGGGAGGNGGATAGSAGSAGAAPGGGGGGADSSGSTVAGGAGAHGQLTITPYLSSAFKTLIVHRPPLGAAKTFQPLVSVGAGGDPPDGTHQYTMPQPVTGVSADFGGTYTVYLVASSWSGGSSSGTTRTITVTVTQYEYAGGPGYSISTLPITVAPNQVNNGIVTAGVLTLPVKAVAPDNLGGYYTVSVTDSNTSDRFWDCIFIDTMGQCVVINEPTSGYVSYYLDAPDPNVSLGRIMGSQLGRPDAISVMDNTPYISGGPLFVEPADGDNQLFIYCADASAPNVSLSYYACYFFDRTQ